jgi:membrane protein implicated in regulation of membrane protease activity
MLLWVTLGTAVVAGGVLALITGEWWTLLIPVALHGVCTLLVVGGVLKLVNEERDKPDPATEARLEEEGRGRATP